MKLIKQIEIFITEGNLKPAGNRRFKEIAIYNGEIKAVGTDIDKIVPPVSCFGGDGRAKKRQGVIERLKIFFEKYFGIGGPASFTELEFWVIVYDLNLQNNCKW